MKAMNLQPRRMLESERMPAYMAIELIEGVTSAGLQALTPRLMRWSETVWILDLSLCSTYWETRAVSLGTTALGLVRKVVEELGGSSVRAALAEHPWQAMLLLTHMRERRLTGLVSTSLGTGSFGEALYKDLSWETWWQCADGLAEHFVAQGRPRFNPIQFRSQCGQMRRAVKRLGLASPWQLKAFQGTAVQRRFGAVLRDMRQWAYEAPALTPGSDSDVPRGLFCPPASASLFDTGFPWQSFVFTSLPSLMRHLESPLCEWSHMEALLREDFDRLCGLSSWLAGEKVVSLEWQLVLPDWSHLVIPIRFRHPHSLHLEKGCHATSLLQALYSFEAETARLRSSNQGVESEIAVLGWTLTIRERLTLPPRSSGLFGDQEICIGTDKSARSPAEMTLLHLENKLKVPLERFVIKPDWLPEDAYGLGEAGYSDDEVLEPHRPSLGVLAETRPLYLYRRPMAFDAQGHSCAWRFTERTMGKWWGADAKGLQRDYYRLTDGEHRDQWVFKDTSGQAFVHGVFA